MKVRAWVIKNEKKGYWKHDSLLGGWTRNFGEAFVFRYPPDPGPGERIVQVEIRTIEKKGKK